jgi:hypothetical protein
LVLHMYFGGPFQTGDMAMLLIFKGRQKVQNMNLIVNIIIYKHPAPEIE